MSLIHCINPATEEEMFNYKVASKDDVRGAIARARKAFKRWKGNSPWERSDFLFEAASIIRNRKEEFAMIITEEMGKPIKESIAEVEKCARGLDYYAENGPRFLEDELVLTEAVESYIAFEPLGIVASIMPWNFPMWQPLRFAAPSLMAGNSVILKPSRFVPRSGMALQEVFEEANLPDDCFQSVAGDSSTGEALLDADVDGYSFTGSVDVGIEIGRRAGSRLKKCVLELGGSDPFIVFADADLREAAKHAVIGKFVNGGQSCIASKRFIVVEDVFDEFVEKFLSNTKRLKVGDPLNKNTDIGPLVSKEALQKIEAQVEKARKDGARILCGGRRYGSKGYFYEPTVIVDVKERMQIVNEEVFGPVAPIISAKDEDDAIRIANSTKFGLGASIWTDAEKAKKIVSQIEAGLVTVNNVVVSDPRMPFGGVKNSGIGRELSRYGMLEFVNVKSVRIHE
ncbi:MAG: NAD-dependent succinate-semialdehyde dehydrogenase [Thaumarchaeota archaeon]|nr:NAD-dependent succinate-semialdehyde dehydrogenase [Nitrososphaerota archaeon]